MARWHEEIKWNVVLFKPPLYIVRLNRARCSLRQWNEGVKHATSGPRPAPRAMTRLQQNTELLTEHTPLGCYDTGYIIYCQISNIGHTKSQNLNVSRLVLQLSYVVGVAQTGAAPTTSEWSTISFPTKAHLISELFPYIPLKLISNWNFMKFPLSTKYI